MILTCIPAIPVYTIYSSITPKLAIDAVLAIATHVDAAHLVLALAGLVHWGHHHHDILMHSGWQIVTEIPNFLSDALYT